MNAPGVVDAFLAQVRSAPERAALVVASPTRPGATERVTFAQLHRRAVSFAAGLREEGFRRGDRVVLALDPCVDFYALALAIVGTGGVVVLIDGAMDRR